MEWNLTWSKYAGTIAAAALSSGNPVPESSKRPEVIPAGAFIWTAFSHLHTCRYFDGGPIPWSEIVGFADRYKLREYEVEELIYYVSILDNKYAEIESKKRRR